MAKTKSVPARMCIGLPRDEAEKGYASDREERRRGNQIGFFGKKLRAEARISATAGEWYRKAQKAKLLHKVFSAVVPAEIYAGIEEEFFDKR